MSKEAIVLLSGGIDSATTLAIARSEGFDCRAITFDYMQRHRCEIEAAQRVASGFGVVEHVVFRMDFRAIGRSALTGSIDVPKDRSSAEMLGIPTTYVPCRNSIFLSIAAGLAEARGCRDVFIGVNAVDYSGYPDCRQRFIDAMQLALLTGTECGVSGDPIQLHAPLIDMKKTDIIHAGIRLGVAFEYTHSCYDPGPNGIACGRCDACLIRCEGFKTAGVRDPTRYAQRSATAST